MEYGRKIELYRNDDDRRIFVGMGSFVTIEKVKGKIQMGILYGAKKCGSIEIDALYPLDNNKFAISRERKKCSKYVFFFWPFFFSIYFKFIVNINQSIFIAYLLLILRKFPEEIIWSNILYRQPIGNYSKFHETDSRRLFYCI